MRDLADKIELLTSAVMINKPVLSFKEAAVYLDFTESYLYKLTSRQEIPHYKPRGKMLTFSRKELDEWQLQRRVKSNHEIEQEAINHNEWWISIMYLFLTYKKSQYLGKKLIFWIITIVKLTKELA